MSSYTIRLRKYISPYADVTSWLVAAGDLVRVEDGAAIIMIPTSQGNEHGIKRGRRANADGIEIIKSVPETERLRILAKVPECSRRSTSTYATLINLCAELYAAA